VRDRERYVCDHGESKEHNSNSNFMILHLMSENMLSKNQAKDEQESWFV
jgi:hypothetical protein